MFAKNIRKQKSNEGGKTVRRASLIPKLKIFSELVKRNTIKLTTISLKIGRKRVRYR